MIMLNEHFFIQCHLKFRLSTVYDQFISAIQVKNSQMKQAVAVSGSGIPVQQNEKEGLDDREVNDVNVCTIENHRINVPVAANEGVERPSVIQKVENAALGVDVSVVAASSWPESVNETENLPKEAPKVQNVHQSSSNASTVPGPLKNNRKRRMSTISGNPNKKQKMAFRCSNCSRQFSREKAWRSHENDCKRGRRRYECYLCEKIALHKNHLLKHMRVHTGQISCCSKCHKPFTSELGLKQHLKTHANLFPFSCSICCQVFSQRIEWKSHESSCKLKQYKCEICEKICANNSHLNYHMQNHTGAMFNCATCKKQFRTKSRFKCHKCDAVVEKELI